MSNEVVTQKIHFYKNNKRVELGECEDDSIWIEQSNGKCIHIFNGAHDLQITVYGSKSEGIKISKPRGVKVKVHTF